MLGSVIAAGGQLGTRHRGRSRRPCRPACCLAGRGLGKNRFSHCSAASLPFRWLAGSAFRTPCSARAWLKSSRSQISLGVLEILPGIMAQSLPSTSSGLSSLVWLSCCAWSFGIKAIANFATVFVPLFIAAVVISAAIVLQDHTSHRTSLPRPPPGPGAGARYGNHHGRGRLYRGRHLHARLRALPEERHPSVLDDAHRHLRGRARHEPACRYCWLTPRAPRTSTDIMMATSGVIGRDHRRRLHG